MAWTAPHRGERLALLLYVLVFFVGTVLWMLVVSVSAGVVVALTSPAATSDPSALVTEIMTPGFLGVTSMVQIAGLGALAVVIAERARQQRPEGARPSLMAFLGVRPAPTAWWAAALVGGLTVWTFPSRMAAALSSWWSWEGTVPLVAEALQGPIAETWPLVLAVGVTAPLFEEIIFRGTLYTLAERAAGGLAAFAFSTVVFAVYHFDPVQVVALLPTAAFIGLLRWQSGSIGPAVLAHFVNNGVGVAFALATRAEDVADPSDELPLGLALAGLGVTVAACTGAWLAARSSSAK